MEFVDFGKGSAAPGPDTCPYDIMKINHDAGLLDAPGKWAGKQLTCVVLGLVRQRTLWPPRDSSSRKPMCESPDAEYGYANIDTFPWEDTGFDKPIPGGSRPHRLECDKCELKNWVDKKPPRCASVWNIPILYGLPSSESLFVIPFTASALGALEDYLRPFRDSRTPTYTALTEIKVSRVDRNGRRYVVPKFTEVGKTDKRRYPEFSARLHEVMDYLQTPPETATAIRPFQVG